MAAANHSPDGAADKHNQVTHEQILERAKSLGISPAEAKWTFGAEVVEKERKNAKGGDARTVLELANIQDEIKTLQSQLSKKYDSAANSKAAPLGCTDAEDQPIECLLSDAEKKFMRGAIPSPEEMRASLEEKRKREAALRAKIGGIAKNGDWSAMNSD